MDPVGMKFNKVTVVSVSGRTACRHKKVICRCDCGTVFETALSRLKGVDANTKSCGCLQKISASARLSKHKMSGSIEYNTWILMRKRCSDTSNSSYKNYGGRGIAVCDSWVNSFDIFFADVGKRPSIKHTLDRIDNDKGYSKDNCRWALRSVQNRNQRSNVWIVFGGLKLIQHDWANLLGVSSALLRKYRKQNKLNTYIRSKLESPTFKIKLKELV